MQTCSPLSDRPPYCGSLYVYYYELTESAQATVDSLEQQKEQLENNVRQAEENVETASENYNASKRSLDQGRLSAEQTRDLRKLAYQTAQETYDITLAYLEEDAAAQEGIYQRRTSPAISRKVSACKASAAGTPLCSISSSICMGALSAASSVRCGPSGTAEA